MKNKCLIALLIFFLILLQGQVLGTSSIPAFPGAEGFGANTIGGRGGQVIEVTNLNDNGPGSLRAAIETEGPRIVVFRVGGTIELESTLVISHPYITIAGQTAPGDGITIKGNGETEVSRTHDVVIRYLRFRGVGRDNQDCLNILHSSYNVIVDHCSFAWGTDETVSVIEKSHDVTIQWSIIAEGLLPSSKGSLISSGAHNVSVHHSLYAHNSERNAKMKGNTEKLEGNIAYFDFVNNVVYNWHGYAHSVAGSGKGNVIANYFKIGPNTGTYPRRREIIRQQFEEGRLLYTKDNVGPSCPDGCDDEWIGINFTLDGKEYQGGMVSDISGGLHPNYSRSFTPIPSAPVTTYPAKDAYENVLAEAGMTFPKRDAVDERIINEVKDGTGKFISDPSEVGGWPNLLPGTPAQDSDHDGMPDDWEIQQGLDPNNYDDNSQDRDGDGYTNVEEYLNSLVAAAANYDLNFDNAIDVTDLVILVSSFGTSRHDLNGDGTVDVQDLLLIIKKL